MHCNLSSFTFQGHTKSICDLMWLNDETLITGNDSIRFYSHVSLPFKSSASADDTMRKWNVNQHCNIECFEGKCPNDLSSNLVPFMDTSETLINSKMLGSNCIVRCIEKNTAQNVNCLYWSNV